MSTPNEAIQIANHTGHMLRALRSAQSKSDAKQVADTWFDWAKKNGVCSQIREHFRDATAETMAGFKAPVARNPAGAD